MSRRHTPLPATPGVARDPKATAYIAMRQIESRMDAKVTSYLCTHNHLFVIIGPHLVWRWLGGANILVLDDPKHNRWMVKGCACCSPMKRHTRLPVRVPPDAVHATLAVGGYAALEKLLVGARSVQPHTGGGFYLDYTP